MNIPIPAIVTNSCSWGASEERHVGVQSELGVPRVSVDRRKNDSKGLSKGYNFKVLQIIANTSLVVLQR